MANKAFNELTDGTTPQDGDRMAVDRGGGPWSTVYLTLLAVYNWILDKLETDNRAVPTGGSTGDVLKRASFGATTWSAEGLVPAGSVVGYVLRQTGGGAYDHGWGAVRELPEVDPGGLDTDKFVKWDGGAWVYAFAPDQSAGSDDQIQYKATGGGFGGASKAYRAPSGSLRLLEDGDTSAAAADSVIVRGQHLAGLCWPGAIDEEGQAAALAWSRAERRHASLTPLGNGSTAPTTFGMPAWTLTGSAGSDTTSFGSTVYASLRNYAIGGAASAGTSIGYHCPQQIFGRGSAARMGGFLAKFTFGFSEAAAVANARAFVGLRASNVQIGNVEPSSLTNLIGIGCDAGETQLSIIHNDGTGTANKTALSSDFPADTRSTDLYKLVLFCPPFANWIGYTATNLTTGAKLSGKLTSDLPTDTSALAPTIWRNNGSTALAVRLSIGECLFETQF